MKAKINIGLSVFFVFFWLFISVFGTWNVPQSWQNFSLFWFIMYAITLIAMNIRIKENK